MKLFRSLLLVAGIAASLNAIAAPTQVDLGNVSTGVTSFYETVGAGFFNETIDFSIGSKSSLATGLQSINVAPSFGIANLNASLFTSSGKLLGSGTNIFLNTPQLAGNYYEVVTGNGTGLAGGLYAGSITVSPVPEASTFAMLLAGLALLGAALYRKKA